MVQKRDYTSFLEHIIKAIEENPELNSNLSIARKMIQNGCDASENHLRLVVASYFEDNPREDVIKAQIEDEPKYEVINNKYVMQTKHGVVNIPVGEVDKLFFDYSEHGRDLTQVQIINKYNLEVWEWNAIKNRLWLYKKSNIYSPHTVEITPREELNSMIEDKLKSLTDNMGEMIEKKYSKHILSEAKKTLEKNERLRLFEKHFLLTDRDENQVAPKIRISRSPEPYSSGHLVIVISDTHFGAKTVGSKIIQDYDRDQAIDWMKKVADDVNSKNAKEVSILLGGDYIESFTGTNHANSFQGMEYGIFGKKAYFNAVDILSDFLGTLNNVSNVLGVSGNHDRADGRRDVDPKGEIGLMILEQLRRDFYKSFSVEYDSLLVHKEIDGIGYGLTHGHNKISKKKAEDLTFDYGNNKIYNVWIQAHLHEFDVIQNTVKVLKVVSPSIFPGNYYSESLGYNSNAGYLELENNGFGKASLKLNTLS